MTAVLTPLTVDVALTAWRVDVPALVLAAASAIVYLRADRRGRAVTGVRRVSFLGLGLGVWLVATCSFVGVYADTLFWVRSLQVILLLMVVPFGLAMGQPLTVLRAGLTAPGQDRFDRVLRSAAMRMLVHPATTSILMLATPWLLFLTPWFHAVLVDRGVETVTWIVLVSVGCAYFYARLQTDPVPRRYSQLISLVVTIAEMLGDGVLGIVLWLGPIVQIEYYTGLGRTWGPSLATDQIVGAGVFWILGDVLGMPFLLALLREFSKDEREKAVIVDEQLDAATPESDVAAPWWLSDPQLQERFRRSE